MSGGEHRRAAGRIRDIEGRSFLQRIQRKFKKNLLSFFCDWCIISEGRRRRPDPAAEQTVNYIVTIKEQTVAVQFHIYMEAEDEKRE